MVQKSNQVAVTASEPHEVTGYRAFKLGQFEFSRDSYFATIKWPSNGQVRTHQIYVDEFLRAMMRDVA
ncbi:hypothetical protein BSFA1_81640 (plasmid) [Burkholderia sp. SFA1]|nr:hypothetical protein BSFA1_81640 [Burkholderia sp. SFA1]